ncbi:E3 ubiquitin-protein ligase RNF149 isoform X1 [Tachyglossus aculeatus]|uniref:E3 ubiquitin-protein ligase RNF149 isoform X1 n=1 Tax=Tachyglossus aculeatus TaxID=9261 RepID=UPI0018F397AB|nr:E3 ubiquitin-protein ligase RNF149 isoform X1 [Tachyglossus aculeatus]
MVGGHRAGFGVALSALVLSLCARGGRGRALEWYSAFVSTEYTDPLTNATVRSGGGQGRGRGRGPDPGGRYGNSSPKEGLQGLVGIPRSAGRAPEGCGRDTRYYVPPVGGPDAAGPEPWIALVARGGCTFRDKVLNAARRNASAVVIYNQFRYGNATSSMSHHGTGNTVVIMVGYPKGIEILEPVRRGIPVKMTIEVGMRHVPEFIIGQSVVFVAIAFITMMIISLAWLIFYYVQRFLYTGSQFGSQSYRKETKKAIGQLQLYTVKREDKEIDIDAENCAVCIENYKPKDVVRILPCKHIFHRTCIDPWLLDHRTCPMCKLDVIKSLGYWGGIEDTQEIAVPDSNPSTVSVVNLSITLQDEDRNEISDMPSSSTSESVPQCISFKEDAGESTALLEYLLLAADLQRTRNCLSRSQFRNIKRIDHNNS